MRLVPLALALIAAPALAQTAAPADRPTFAASVAPDSLTDAERAVLQTIRGEGVHVVHLWAPWCGNSTAEYETGWYEVLERHPDVSFTFVTVWNDGDPAADVLARYGIPASAAVLAQPDRGPSADRTLRRRLFLGLPVSWTPTTWVFNRGGDLAYAFNYGEVSAEMLETAIQHAQAPWEHD